MSDIIYYSALMFFGFVITYMIFFHESVMIRYMDYKGTRPRCNNCDEILEDPWGIPLCMPCYREYRNESERKYKELQDLSEYQRIKKIVEEVLKNDS